MHEAIDRILVSEEVIGHRIDVLAGKIMEGGVDDLMIVVLLKGAMVFGADLFRRMPVRLDLECMNISSYHGGMKSSGEVKFLDVGMPDFLGKRVIVVDDIFDTGLTMEAVCGVIKGAGASSVESCVLLAKDKERGVEYTPDYVGFTIGDEFVVGYGLDYKGKYRNLPYVGVLREDVI